jgi:hypothetical protein
MSHLLEQFVKRHEKWTLTRIYPVGRPNRPDFRQKLRRDQTAIL